MRLQQLRYLIAVAERGSMSAAAQDLFVSQSSLSVAVRELEQEMGVQIFDRTSRGLSLTPDGAELLTYARQVVEQAELMLQRYAPAREGVKGKLSISSQHYAFVVAAFTELVNAHPEPLDLALRETRTAEIIEDVASFKADLGVLYLSPFNEHVLSRRLDDAGLAFETLVTASPHIFVREGHPLAALAEVHASELADYPRLEMDQGSDSSLFYAEEPYAANRSERRIVASDRGTLTTLLKRTDAYLTASGILEDESYEGVTTIPLHSAEVLNIGLITHKERKLSPLAEEFIARLKQQVATFA